MRQLLSALKLKLFSQKPKVERRKATAKIARMPEAGEFIFYHQLKMEVTETKNQELMKWLLKHGWRPQFKNDRRQYALMPEDTFAKLDMAPTSERPMLIRSLLRQYK